MFLYVSIVFRVLKTLLVKLLCFDAESVELSKNVSESLKLALGIEGLLTHLTLIDVFYV